MATIRKRGKFYYFRGTIPARQADGTIARVRHEESLKTVSRADAAKRAADIERHYWKLAHEPQQKRGPTFAQAALTYIETRGKSDRFVHKLIEHFGDRDIGTIDQQAATEAASKLYPGWKASSINRAIYTPLSAILELAGCRGTLRRPTVEQSPISIPDEQWFDAFLAANPPPKLAALVLFVTLTGRRVGEALALTEKDVAPDGTIIVSRTKTGVPVVVRMPDLCRVLLRGADDYYRRKGVGQPSKRLFGYASLPAAHVALRRVCDRAGLPCYGFHAIGRHAFATRGLKAGKSIKWLQLAGGWKSHKSLDRYLHLEQSEVARDVEALGEEWSRKRKT